MTIKNKGYESFSTLGNYFYVIADNVKYSYDVTTFYIDNWETVDILDDGT